MRHRANQALRVLKIDRWKTGKVVKTEHRRSAGYDRFAPDVAGRPRDVLATAPACTPAPGPFPLARAPRYSTAKYSALARHQKQRALNYQLPGSKISSPKADVIRSPWS
jgi:hypothetical protein